MEIQCSKYQNKLRRFKAQVVEYESAFREALQVIESEDSSLYRTASLQKEMLQKEYVELLEIGQELLDLVPNVDGVDPCDKVLFECSKMKLNYRKTLTSLEKVSQKVEADDRERLARASPAPIAGAEVSGIAGSTHIKPSNVLKIKVSAPKFSGKSREFAVFKRDF